VAHPLHIRYGWDDFPVLNLINGSGLPASPFRTDHFRGVTQN
jgi:sialate O-acetylesterase